MAATRDGGEEEIGRTADGRRTKALLFSYERRGRPSLVEPKIKEEDALERRGTDGKERRRTSVVDDDDSVLPGVDRRSTHRADPRSYKPLIRVRQSTGSRERTQKERGEEG